MSGTRKYGVKLVRGPFVTLAPHPEACADEKGLYAYAARSRRPMAIDLFCGAGGLSLGLEQAGFDVILGIDHDAEAVETHRALFPGLTVDWDLADPAVVDRVADIVKRAGVTLVAGGPPCQPFSKAGRSMIRDLVRRGLRGKDHRRDLWQSFLAVVAQARPPAVLMENVPDMALDRDMMILRTMVDELEKLGYAVEQRLVETRRYGVPQFRQRLILVALSDRTIFAWPPESESRVSVWDAIGDLPAVEGGWRPDGGADGWADYEVPLTPFQEAARTDVAPADSGKVFDHITRPVREDDLEVFRSMTSETRYSDLEEKHRRYRADIFDDKYKRLSWWDVSRTITAHIAKDGYWYIHPEQPRTLTVREAARLQTFPDTVRFAGPPSAAFRQIGNAVPPAVGRAMGTAILTALDRPERAPWSTQQVARTLAAWFTGLAEEDVTMPWLKAPTRWLALQGLLLFDRAAPDPVRFFWPLMRHFPEPTDTLAAPGQLRAVAESVGRADRVGKVLAAAAWFAEHPENLASIEGMAAAPGVGRAVAQLVSRIVTGDEDPVIATHGVLRVAQRFTGREVYERNRLSEGRLAVARMIGVDPVSDLSHVGLVALANTVCTPRRPRCEVCRLRPWCATANATIDLDAAQMPSDAAISG